MQAEMNSSANLRITAGFGNKKKCCRDYLKMHEANKIVPPPRVCLFIIYFFKNR